MMMMLVPRDSVRMNWTLPAALCLLSSVCTSTAAAPPLHDIGSISYTEEPKDRTICW